jgi:hypothetical protein
MDAPIPTISLRLDSQEAQIVQDALSAFEMRDDEASLASGVIDKIESEMERKGWL